MTHKAKTILKNVFGYDEFVSLQEEIIKNVLRKNNTLVIMPTGGGKSLCYQIPALIFHGLTIVVSPLISLMKDQVEQLKEVGVDTVLLNSSISPAEYRRNVERIKQEDVKLLYIAPESLLKPNILALLSSVQVDCLAIDEAHCISQWGHDFRPEYRQLVDVRNTFKTATCIALTATATPRVKEDIKNNLGFDTSNEYIASFNRPNLFLEIVHKSSALKQTLNFIKKFPDDSGIIYCFTRKQVDNLYEILKEKGFSAKPYHAGLSEQERNRNQELFIRDDTQIIVATIAFGMGIDKSNIRFVVHYDLPQNIESYYQEIGRAGRDGLQAHCFMLFSYADIQKIKHFIKKKTRHEQRVANIHLNALIRFAETVVCRRVPLLNYFGEDYSAEKCNMCDSCLAGEKDWVDITIPAQKFLSCVKRTNEIFGTVHIIDILRESKAQKVFKFDHQKLSTYGIGKDYSKRQWQQLSHQFLHKGLLTQDMEFGGLKLTQKAWDVLRGKEIVQGRLEEEWPNNANKKEPRDETKPDYDPKLFEILRKKRKTLADNNRVPPYVIFSDKTLSEMATFFPQTKENFLKIHGVGAVKYEKYGLIFLNIITEHCHTNQIEEISPRRKTAKAIISRSVVKKRHILIGEIFNSGKSISHIMAKFGIKRITVLDHLFKYLQEGYSLRFDESLAPSTIQDTQKDFVLETFDRLGTELLRPVFDALNGEVRYDDLKILRLYYLSKKIKP